MAGLRENDIHQSLVRPQLILGAERELALLAVMISAFIAYCAYLAFNLLLGIVAFVLWTVMISMLRRMSKADPMMFGNYRRHIRYKAHYLGHSTPFRLNNAKT